MIPPDLLAILRCPETHQPLAPADPDALATANARRPAGTEWITAGLVTADRTRLYPVQEGIPILLVEAAVAL